MPKKNRYESFVYHLFRTLDEMGGALEPSGARAGWERWIDSMQLEYAGGSVTIDWLDAEGAPGSFTADLSPYEFYVRGDDDRFAAGQQERGITAEFDAVRERNRRRFRDVANEIAQLAGFEIRPENSSDLAADSSLLAEEQFHDEWAASVNVEKLDVRKISEALTSPELRFIAKTLGNLKGKKLLDVGCGLGEAGVYFAIQGADVTAMDLSQGMLDAAKRLAAAHGVTLNTHKSAAERTLIPDDAKFDVIYAGNVLHHVDIDVTLRSLKPHLAHDGVFVSWDPLAYNPVINVYRRIATKVRTEDEHPLSWSDVKLIRGHFPHVEMRYFWLTTLAVFIVMAVFQRRNPNEERYWKSVVDESEKWAPLYRPLEVVDRFLLKFIPPLRLLCWNVVIVARSSATARGD